MNLILDPQLWIVVPFAVFLLMIFFYGKSAFISFLDAYVNTIEFNIQKIKKNLSEAEKTLKNAKEFAQYEKIYEQKQADNLSKIIENINKKNENLFIQWQKREEKIIDLRIKQMYLSAFTSAQTDLMLKAKEKLMEQFRTHPVSQKALQSFIFKEISDHNFSTILRR